MSFTITESDVWPRLGASIAREVDRRTVELRQVSPEQLKTAQAWIEALCWVLEEAKPKPSPRQE